MKIINLVAVIILAFSLFVLLFSARLSTNQNTVELHDAEPIREIDLSTIDLKPPIINISADIDIHSGIATLTLLAADDSGIKDILFHVGDEVVFCEGSPCIKHISVYEKNITYYAIAIDNSENSNSARYPANGKLSVGLLNLVIPEEVPDEPPEKNQYSSSSGGGSSRKSSSKNSNDNNEEEDADNILDNANFDNADYWSFYNNGVSEYTIGANPANNDMAYHIVISSKGSNTQLYQNNLLVESNTKYVLSFDASSPTKSAMDISLLKHTVPYTYYGLNKHYINLSEDWNRYVIKFSSPAMDSAVNDARLMFWIASYANSGDEYWIDNVILTKCNDCDELMKDDNKTLPINTTPINTTKPLNGTLPQNGTLPPNSTNPSNITFPSNSTLPKNSTIPTNNTGNSTIPTNNSGTIYATSSPSGANLYIDNVLKGITPKTVAGITAGNHSITFKKTGYKDYTTTRNVIQGRTINVTATLSQISSTLPKNSTIPSNNTGNATKPANATGNKTGNVTQGTLPIPSKGKKWVMTFNDEFNGNSIDKKKWNGGYSNLGWCPPNAGERGACPNQYSGLKVSDGTLKLQPKVTDDFSTAYENRAMINTGGPDANNAPFSQRYGYFEVRAKFPTNKNGEGDGLWISFWALPLGKDNNAQNLGDGVQHEEVDILESVLGNNTYYTHLNLHDYTFGQHSLKYPESNKNNLSDAFHTYGLYWKDDGSEFGAMQVYFDGKPQGKAIVLDSRSGYWNNGIYLLLQVIPCPLKNKPFGGGNACSSETSNNNPFIVDYVRAYKEVS